MPHPKLSRSQACALAEVFGEGTLIAEAVIHGDIGKRSVGAGESLGGGFDSHTHHEFVRSDAEGLLKLAVKVAL